MQLVQITLNLLHAESGSGQFVCACHAVHSATVEPCIKACSAGLSTARHLCTTAQRPHRHRGSHPLSCRLQVAELRRHGVTLTLSLERPREPIPDVPAVYFLTATEGNIAAVVSCTVCCMQSLSCGVHAAHGLFGRPDSAE